ncbi:hypothetical protein [Uliginosibacterium sediminicola]|jgi:hypothetical protein|uniref:Uncharacterized protein n=1 Tax=Uliginosibacterium sediminicola TaxID=2024550 RepID=A0ABU9YWZ9_9RHOO
MQSVSSNYKGFLIEPLVYLLAPTAASGRQRPLDKRYQASVQITNVDTQDKQVIKLPLSSQFECVGDARRAAELYGRALVDNPKDHAETLAV